MKKLKIKKTSAKKSYGKWDQTYYQITPEGKRKSGLLRRLTPSRFWQYCENEVLDYLARYPRQPRSLEQIYKGISQVNRAETIKAVGKLKRKGWIKRVK